MGRDPPTLLFSIGPQIDEPKLFWQHLVAWFILMKGTSEGGVEERGERGEFSSASTLSLLIQLSPSLPPSPIHYLSFSRQGIQRIFITKDWAFRFSDELFMLMHINMVLDLIYYPIHLRDFIWIPGLQSSQAIFLQGLNERAKLFTISLIFPPSQFGQN